MAKSRVIQGVSHIYVWWNPNYDRDLLTLIIKTRAGASYSFPKTVAFSANASQNLGGGWKTTADATLSLKTAQQTGSAVDGQEYELKQDTLSDSLQKVTVKPGPWIKSQDPRYPVYGGQKGWRTLQVLTRRTYKSPPQKRLIRAFPQAKAIKKKVPGGVEVQVMGSTYTSMALVANPPSSMTVTVAYADTYTKSLHDRVKEYSGVDLGESLTKIPLWGWGLVAAMGIFFFGSKK
jgi:hypothetical protein